ncbi:MAG TPA: DUF1176 domain-containing protein [Telluria sp.]|nr:DUF1176 domain-containing protein [Telluria sp.]
MIPFPLLLAGLLGAAPAPGLSFVRHDWELVCDNTRTCRAAGYQADDPELPAVSVLVTRAAGPGQAPRVQLQLGSYGADAPVPAGEQLTMQVDGHAAGKVQVPADTGIGELAPKLAATLLAALARNAEVAWTDGAATWVLSGKGSSAVFLKMDDFQGRVGTPGALVRKGAKPEEGVAPALPAPVVLAAPVPRTGADDPAFKRIDLRQLAADLRKSVSKDDCERLDQLGADGKGITLARLSDSRLLASAACWMGAYNTGDAYWVINQAAPYAPQLVTTNATEYSDGTLTSTQKGRGLGDCGASEEWVWTGDKFTPTRAASSGMCRLVAPGGAWELPELVTQVQRRPK